MFNQQDIVAGAQDDPLLFGSTHFAIGVILYFNFDYLTMILQFLNLESFDVAIGTFIGSIYGYFAGLVLIGVVKAGYGLRTEPLD